MRARISIATSSQETGALLSEYLTARGIELTTDKKVPVISYGVPRIEAIHVLNKLHGRGKVWNMEQMQKGGVRTVPYFSAAEWNGSDERGKAALLDIFSFPMLARKLHGYGGTDIRPVFEPKEIPWRIASGSDWFSTYVPVRDEFRVWAFRNEVLGMYKKQMNRPGDYKTIGRNFANGFDFVPADYDAEAAEAALKVLRALNYDFAAIDMIRGEDGRIYVLETNSAPGAIKSGAQLTLGKLADRMTEWVKVCYK